MEQYKLAIVSDTHGNWQKAAEALQTEPDITHLVFLGDHAADGVSIANALNIPVYIVRGNCDRSSDGLEEQIVSLGDWRLFICHGHRYRVKETLQPLYYRALELGVDFALYGHTHIAVHEPGEVTLINPGSLSDGNLLLGNASWGVLTLPAQKPKNKAFAETVENTEKIFVKYEKKTCQTS